MTVVKLLDTFKPQRYLEKLGNNYEVLTETIVPDEHDIERASNGSSYGSDRLRTIAKAIKDANKALRRGVAFVKTNSFNGVLAAPIFRARAVELGATPDMLKDYDDTIAAFQKEEEAKSTAKRVADMERLSQTIPEGLVKNLDSSAKVQATIKSQKRFGYIYKDYIMENGFNGEAYYFNDLNSGKEFPLARTFHTGYGPENYKWEIENIIIPYKVRKA